MISDSTIVDGKTFLVTDPEGRVTRDHDGLFTADTRHLDTYEFTLTESTLEPLEVHSPHPGRRDLHLSTPIERGSRSVSVRRRQALADGLYERIEIENLTTESVSDTLEITVGTEFLDLFEVRGETQIDRSIETWGTDTGVSFEYDPDDVAFSRQTHVRADTQCELSDRMGTAARGDFRIDIELEPRATERLHIGVTFEESPAELRSAYERAAETTQQRTWDWNADTNIPNAVNPEKAAVLKQSFEDLLSLRLETKHGPILMAGTPWFATGFGRDSLIAAYQSLSVAPDIAKGTLRYLAAHQATENDDFRDAKPGKIFHEIREGELTVRNTVPHSPYYGTVDATALWIVLLHETYHQTDDHELVEDLRNSLDAALEWLKCYCDRDNNGFLEYDTDRLDDVGLTHQAWKDSGDGIMYPDGTHPEGPIALAEIQGYYYDALIRAADLFEMFGEQERTADLRERASELKAAFDEQFWLPKESFYAVGLDGEGNPIDCVTTNPGHCLWSGIVPESRADKVIDRLIADDMFSGWGIRTVSADHEVYNPQSYHLGSVWPHDNSLIVLGMVAYDRFDAAQTVTDGLFDTATARGNDRLPELFSGFNRNTSNVPVEYGTACEPQAWAAATPIACYAALRSQSEATEQVLTKTD
ncbi:glycogen debranching N-terminal domain-containing protein [Halobium palmae]|uniref:Glycogen debranching N-terminal domain-containing protein n=1 Tax=Halobium palmae TaxID=1776492 RepID=A0ABD5RVI5_9EURY